MYGLSRVVVSVIIPPMSAHRNLLAVCGAVALAVPAPACDGGEQAPFEFPESVRGMRVDSTARADFDSFWASAARKVHGHPLKAKFTELVDEPFDTVRIFDVVVPGLDGTGVKAWFVCPAYASETNKVPCAVVYHGGGGRRGKDLFWASSGMAMLMMDFRMQGGETGSSTAFEQSCGTHFIGYNLMKRKEDYYLYHVWTDALLVLRAAFEHPFVDASKVVVWGQSQGGGTALMAAALEPRVARCFACVPSYCWWERRIATKTASAARLADYLEEHPSDVAAVMDKLSYFDGMNFAARIKCPVRGYVCGKDTAVPADCVFATFNHISAPKDLRELPFGQHKCYDFMYREWIKDLQREWHFGKTRRHGK